MRKTLSISLLLPLFLLGNATAGKHDLASDVRSGSPFTTLQRATPDPVVPQYDYDLALTNIGIEAQPNDCLEEGETWKFWVKVQNVGSEIADCAEIIFTINGEEVGRTHVSGLYPGEARKLLWQFGVQWQYCDPFIIDAHVDWPPDENPANNDVEDEFAVAGGRGPVLMHDDGIVYNGWTWDEGLEYPDYAQAAKYYMEYHTIVRYWEWYYTNLAGRPGGHVELFVWPADPHTGYPVDDGTGGLFDMEFQMPEVYWPDYAYVCYPICMPVSPGECYFFGVSNRQGGVNYFGIDSRQDDPDWNWYKQNGTWYQGNLYDGDFWVHVALQGGGLQMMCETLTPVFCRGRYFYFKVTVEQWIGPTLTGPMTFSGYSGYDCDPANVRVAIPTYKSYPSGITEEYYYFRVPNAAQPGQYSASIYGVLNGYEIFCCMNTDIIQCGPWKEGINDEWGLVQVDRPEVVLPTSTSLHQNYPNPFNEETNIGYTLADAGHVSLKVYDIAGRLVETLIEGHQEAGGHGLTWEASSLSSGVYFYKLQAGDYISTKKMNLLK